MVAIFSIILIPKIDNVNSRLVLKLWQRQSASQLDFRILSASSNNGGGRRTTYYTYLVLSTIYYLCIVCTYSTSKTWYFKSWVSLEARTKAPLKSTRSVPGEAKIMIFLMTPEEVESLWGKASCQSHSGAPINSVLLFM